MKTLRSSRNALLLLVASLFLIAYAAPQVMSSELQSPRTAVAGSGFVQSAKGPARLIIRRLPNLGYNIGVQLWIDGVPAGPIIYGHIYEGFLAPGRHTLSVLPAPNPRWRVPWQMTLDVQSGQTYSFTAMSYSGHLVLNGHLGFPVRIHY